MAKAKLDLNSKISHMAQLADFRENQLRHNPILRDLFLELTLECNCRCLHCGSNCEPVPRSQNAPSALTLQEYQQLLRQAAQDFDLTQTRLCITGGEPLLRPDFFDIMEYARDLGFRWGMTTNATTITPEVAQHLYDAGMSTVSVSLDGLEQEHDWFRQTPGSYQRAVRGIKALVGAAQGRHVQVTTCVHSGNIHQLEAMYQEFCKLGITSWRVFNVEPMGRAKENTHILLDDRQLRQVLAFVRKKYADPSGMPVTYSCSHYLGVDLERETRPWYFLCSAGVYVASVAANGDILACLDIERRPELVQGNVRTDRLADVWQNRFEIFRSDWRRVGKCADCECWDFCAGDSFHTWDMDAMQPGMCLKGVAF